MMITEKRQYEIAEAFYHIAIYAVVTHTHSRDGLARLEYIKGIVDKIPIVGDVDNLNFNHRYFTDILEDAIKRNIEFNQNK
tara:strand:- start:225 stop:467 length:243 start_codon:yes stop_codon:yes gene_type:complete